jgi:anti-sigma factor RsiW
MNDCASFRGDLDAYRDNRLDENRQFEVNEHLQSCTACQQEAAWAAAIELELKNQASGWTPTEGLWARIKNSAQLESSADPVKGRRFYQLPWAAVALLVVALGVVSFSLVEDMQQASSELVAAALVNEFHTFVVSHRELDYQDSQPVEIRKWFGDKVNFRVPLPVKTDDLQLAGGRLCNMFDQRIASFMYRIDDAWVSLYIMRSKPHSSSTADNELLLQGYGYIDWENQGLHYSLVGEVAIERLRQIATSLRSTQLLTNLQGFRSASMQNSRLPVNSPREQRKNNA